MKTMHILSNSHLDREHRHEFQETRLMMVEMLDDVIRIFVYADTVTRVRRVIEVDQVDEKEALRRMKRIDKERKEYHRYFTGREWMDMENYDLPINASRIDYDQMIKLIKDYLVLRGYEI